MLYRFLSSTVLPHKGHCSGENTLPALPGLDCAGCKGFAFADMLDVKHDWYLAIACKNEVAVHAMDCEVAGDSFLGRGETLCNDGTAVDSAGSWGVPEGSGIGEHILEFQTSVSGGGGG